MCMLCRVLMAKCCLELSTTKCLRGFIISLCLLLCFPLSARLLPSLWQFLYVLTTLCYFIYSILWLMGRCLKWFSSSVVFCIDTPWRSHPRLMVTSLIILICIPVGGSYDDIPRLSSDSYSSAWWWHPPHMWCIPTLRTPNGGNPPTIETHPRRVISICGRSHNHSHIMHNNHWQWRAQPCLMPI